jgi:antitoxin HicB
MSNEKTFDHSGSTFDSFLEEEHILQETEAVAVKRVLAWKLEQAMKEKKVSKYALAKELHTSRSQVDRLLDPSHVGVTIGTITRAAMSLGKRIRLEIVNEEKHRPFHRVSAERASAERVSAKRAATKKRPQSNRYAKAACAGAD